MFATRNIARSWGSTEAAIQRIPPTDLMPRCPKATWRHRRSFEVGGYGREWWGVRIRKLPGQDKDEYFSFVGD